MLWSLVILSQIYTFSFTEDQFYWSLFDTNSSYFQVYNKTLTYWQANEYCVNQSSTLATVTSVDDHKQLVEKLKWNGIDSSWIGLTSFGELNRFYWMSQYPSLSAQFITHLNEDERDSQDCVRISKNQSGDYIWIQSNCGEHHSFICTKITKSHLQKLNFHPIQKGNRCPESFIYIDQKCFWITHSTSRGSSAQEMCQTEFSDSTIASITTDFQLDCLSAVFSERNVDVYIGLQLQNNQYYWKDNNSVFYSNWASGQPNINKNCVVMLFGKKNLGEWFSVSCEKELNVLCEVNATTTNLRTEDKVFVQSDCASGFYKFGNSCYMIMNKTASFNNSSTICQQRNPKMSSHLFILSSVAEKKFIEAYLKNISNSEKAVWLKSIRRIEEDADTIHVSVDESMIDVIKTPIINSDKYNCLLLDSKGSVQMHNCSSESIALPLCEYQIVLDKAVSSLKEATYSCTENWYQNGTNCYFFDFSFIGNQFEAKNKCKSLDGNLVSIDSIQQQFLLDYLKSSNNANKMDSVWIGLEAWIYNDGNATFKWTDNSSIRFLNINVRNLKFENVPRKFCTVLSVNSHVWKLVNCTESNLILCHRQANMSSKLVTSTIPSTTSVAETTTESPVQRFITVSRSATWYKANKTCHSLSNDKRNYSLLSFKSFTEMKKILGEFATGYHRIWIGLHGLYDRFDNVFLKWSDGTSDLNFQNFDYLDLMNASKLKNCVGINVTSGKWFALSCTENLPFICKLAENDMSPSSLKDGYKAHICPSDFVEHLGKCYKVIDDVLKSWVHARHYCQRFDPSASLAVIENKYENSFVYSLLSDNLFRTNVTGYWINGKSENEISNPYCQALSGHPDPLIGARWFSELCGVKLKFICYIHVSESLRNRNSICGQDYVEFNSSVGTSCYRYFDYRNQYFENRNQLSDLKGQCAYNKAHIVTIKSHYHLHFLSSFLQFKGASMDSALWLDTELYPYQILNHWQWSNGYDIRYSFWQKEIFPFLKSFEDQIAEGSLCFFMRLENTELETIGFFAKQCHLIDTMTNYVVCEREFSAPKLSNDKSNCLRDPLGSSYQGIQNTSVTGHRCIRWDLIPTTSPDYGKLVDAVRNDRNKTNYIQFHSNECRYFPGFDYNTTFCVISISGKSNPVSFEPCAVLSCDSILKKLDHRPELMVNSHPGVTTVLLVIFLLIVCVTVCIALLAWRRWNKNSIFGGYLRRNRFSFTSSQARGTSFNNPIYRPISC